MAAYKKSVAEDYQARFDKLKETMKGGGDLSNLVMEDPEHVEKREQEVKDAKALADSLTL